MALAPAPALVGFSREAEAGAEKERMEPLVEAAVQAIVVVVVVVVVVVEADEGAEMLNWKPFDEADTLLLAVEARVGSIWMPANAGAGAVVANPPTLSWMPALFADADETLTES